MERSFPLRVVSFCRTWTATVTAVPRAARAQSTWLLLRLACTSRCDCDCLVAPWVTGARLARWPDTTARPPHAHGHRARRIDRRPAHRGGARPAPDQGHRLAARLEHDRGGHGAYGRTPLDHVLPLDDRRPFAPARAGRRAARLGDRAADGRGGGPDRLPFPGRASRRGGVARKRAAISGFHRVGLGLGLGDGRRPPLHLSLRADAEDRRGPPRGRAGQDPLGACRSQRRARRQLASPPRRHRGAQALPRLPIHLPRWRRRGPPLEDQRHPGVRRFGRLQGLSGSRQRRDGRASSTGAGGGSGGAAGRGLGRNIGRLRAL